MPRRSSILRMIALVVGLLAASRSNAVTVLDDDELKTARGFTVLRIESVRNPSMLLGFGVVISAQGHVLTAAHIVKDVSEGDLAGRPINQDNAQPRKLTIVAKLDDPKIDVALLRFQGGLQDGISPAPIFSGGDLKSPPFRILTGSVGLHALVAIDAKGTILNGPILEFDGFANVGSSGSPLFDKVGNLVGLVTRGTAGGVFYAKPIGVLMDWLMEKNVKLIQSPPPPVKTEVYVTESSVNVSEAALQTVVSTLIDALSTSAKNYLRPEPEIHLRKINQWEKVAERAFEEADTKDQRQAEIETYLNRDDVKAWLKSQDFSLLYLLIIEIRHGPLSLQPVLLLIDHQVTTVKVREFQVYTRTLSTDPSHLNALAVEQLQNVFRKFPRLGDNQFVLAECFNLLGSNAGQDWITYSPQIFGGLLDASWRSKNHHYKAKPASIESCYATLNGKPRSLGPEYLSEVMIKVWILPDSKTVRWQASPPWDEGKRVSKTLPNSFSALTEREFETITRELVSEIVNSWPEVLKKARE